MKRRLTQQDLRAASMDMETKRRFYRKGMSAPVLPGDARMALKQFARETYHLTSGKKIAPDEWEDRLDRVFQTRNPEIREVLMSQLKLRNAER